MAKVGFWRIVLTLGITMAALSAPVAPTSAESTEGQPQQNAGQGPQPSPSESPGQGVAEEVRTVRGAFDVSVVQAEHNLAIQRRANKVNIVDQLAQKLGPEYAGIWFDNETGEFVVPVAAAGLPEAAIRNRKAAVGSEFVAAALEGTFRSPVVNHSWGQLEAGQLGIDEKLSAYFAQHLVQTSIDPGTNAVVVRIAEGAADATVAAIRQSLRGASVKVELRETPDALFKIERNACNEATRLCDRPVRGGAFIYPGPYWLGGQEVTNICSAAFRANGYDGKKYILTAGHCMLENGKPGGTPIWSTFTVDTTGHRRPIGTTSQWHWPGKDWAKIDATGSWADSAPWPTVLAYWGGPHEYPVTGQAKSYKGQTLCHIGANTGTSCGIVREANMTVEYYGGEKLNGMFEVGGKGLCQGGGDSGGPWIASNIALGIHSGGNEWCYHEWSRAYFSDIMAATAELNVNINGPGAPETITGAATNVLPRQANVSGQVDPHGLATNYRFEYGQGGYTQSTPDTSAGAGQGFVSVGTTLTNLDPNATYKYRIRATNSLNTAYGAESTFTTPPVPPVVTTEPATNISGTTAALRATIDPEGAATTYYFEYGTSPAFGQKTGEFLAGSGRTPITFPVSVSELEFGENYYFRVVAKSSGGTSTGATRSFTPGWRATTPVQIPTGLEAPFQSPSVDCPAVHSCVAVVTGAGPTEYLQSFASTYDGSKWTSMKIPQPIAGGDRSHFADIACVTTTNCRAVGWAREPSTGVLKAAVAHWDGSTWQSGTIAAPPGATMVVPSSIACPTSTYCVAVGYLYDASGVRRELNMHWNGTSWSYPPSPPSEGATYGFLTGAACTSATNCYATGAYLKGSEWVVSANRWNGVAWTREVLKTYLGSSQLHRVPRVSCIGATMCIGGGVSTTGGKNVPWLAQTNGAGWTTTPLTGLPLATDKSSGFNDVECGSETLCEGVGYVENASGELLPLAARLRAGSWQRQILPALAPGRSILTDLSCVSATYCMSVGTRDGHPNTAPIAGLYAK